MKLINGVNFINQPMSYSHALNGSTWSSIMVVSWWLTQLKGWDKALVVVSGWFFFSSVSNSWWATYIWSKPLRVGPDGITNCMSLAMVVWFEQSGTSLMPEFELFFHFDDQHNLIEVNFCTSVLILCYTIYWLLFFFFFFFVFAV